MEISSPIDLIDIDQVNTLLHVLQILIAFFAVCFVVSLVCPCGDLVMTFLQILSRFNAYFYLYPLCCLLLYLGCNTFDNGILYYINVLGSFNCVLSIVLFMFISYYHIRSYTRTKSNKIVIDGEVELTFMIWFVYSFLVTIVSSHTYCSTMCGILTVVFYYNSVGFLFESAELTTYIGFSDTLTVLNISIASVILQVTYFIVHNKIIDVGIFYDYVLPFHVGVYFCSSFVLSLSLLIMSSKLYWQTFNLQNKLTSPVSIFICTLLSNVISFTIFVIMILIGIVYDIESMRNTAGVFMFFLIMELQLNIFGGIKRHWKSLFFGLTLMNLLAIYYTICNYLL